MSYFVQLNSALNPGVSLFCPFDFVVVAILALSSWLSGVILLSTEILSGTEMTETAAAFKESLSEERKAELRRIANAIVQPGKGILAADESTGEIKMG